MPIAGVSETERRRRKESNLFTTKINFYAWLLEVLKIFQKSNQKYNPNSLLLFGSTSSLVHIEPKKVRLKAQKLWIPTQYEKTGTSRGTRFLPFFMQDSEKYSYYGKIQKNTSGPKKRSSSNFGSKSWKNTQNSEKFFGNPRKLITREKCSRKLGKNTSET